MSTPPCRQSKLSSEELRLLRATDLIGQKETMKQKLKRCVALRYVALLLCALALSCVALRCARVWSRL